MEGIVFVLRPQSKAQSQPGMYPPLILNIQILNDLNRRNPWSRRKSIGNSPNNAGISPTLIMGHPSKSAIISTLIQLALRC